MDATFHYCSYYATYVIVIKFCYMCANGDVVRM